MTAIDPIDKALEETFPASDPPAVSAEPRRAAPTDRSDHPNRRGSATHQDRTASEESGQDLVAQTRVRGDQSPERITRNGDDFAGFGNPGRNEHALAGQEIQLAKEPAGSVAGDDPLLTLGVDDDLDGAGKDDVEIIAGVALPVEVLTGRDRSPNAELPQRRQFGVAELLEGIWISSHGTKPYDFV